MATDEPSDTTDQERSDGSTAPDPNDGTTVDSSTANMENSWWVRTYLLVPIVASAAAVGLAVVDPARASLGPARYTGVVGVAAGLLLVGWTVRTYNRARETLSPVVEPDRVVTSGPLAWTRNPMYLGVVATVAGIAILAESAVVVGYAGLLALVYHGIVVGVEEPKLADAFGDAYRSYRDAVPRWLPRRRD